MVAAAAMAAGRDLKKAEKLLGSGATISIGREMLCPRMWDFFWQTSLSCIVGEFNN